ncbi:hypothetical protein B296_00036173 [Ensete ventricosum]|uniref:Uncharacterized protein n=1 Tax=Ensete ventricosum TaxID=4639 RepID=A0A426XU46_ENSVE|nr:hypothetical protein B296_00036173 [Ensete ventricosum]
MSVFKPIELLNSISLKVYDSNLHPCSIGGSLELKIVLRMRDPSDQVSFIPFWKINLYAWIVGIRELRAEEGSRLMDLRLGGRRWRRCQKQLWELLGKVKVAEMATGQQERSSDTR